jgi:DNA mismatch endonuclease, patch repair protein
VAVFVDGAFWHGHPSAFTPGKSGAYWDEKIPRNVRRDREADAALHAMGWTVIRLWDFDVRRDPDACLERIEEALRRVRDEEERATESRNPSTPVHHL